MPVEPARIRLVLDQVADSDEPAAPGHLPQPRDLGRHVGGGQVGPPHHARDHAGLGRQGEELLGFRRAGQHLNQNAGTHPVFRADPGEVREAEPAAQRGEPVEPAVRPGIGIPYVMVRVDDHVPGRHAGPPGNENSVSDSGLNSADAPGSVGAT